MGFSGDDVLEILKLLNESEFGELRLESGALKLIVKKHAAQGAVGEPELSLLEPTEAKGPERCPELPEL